MVLKDVRVKTKTTIVENDRRWLWHFIDDEFMHQDSSRNTAPLR